MFPIAWITLRRITERAILIQFGILALVLAYVALGLDAIVLSDTAGTEQDGVMVIWLFLSTFTLFWTTMEIPREVSRKEAHVYLSKPMSRLSYLLGKFIGMTGMTLGGEAALLAVFVICLCIKGVSPSAWVPFAAARTALFLILLNAICTLASVALGEVRGMFFVGAVVLAGLAVCAVPVLAWSGFYARHDAMIETAHYLVPDMLHYRWEPLAGSRVGFLGDLLAYTIGWTFLALGIGRAVLIHRDLA